MFPKNCLVCYSPINPFRKPRSSGQDDVVVVLDSDDESETLEEDSSSNKLEEQLSMIFLLREVFELPKHKLVKYFDRSRGCNPSRWGVGLCGDCRQLLGTLQELFSKLNRITRKYNSAKESLCKRVWRSYMKTGRVSGSITDETREFVSDNDYTHLSTPPKNPFDEGDLQARNLLPPSRHEFTPEAERSKSPSGRGKSNSFPQLLSQLTSGVMLPKVDVNVTFTDEAPAGINSLPDVDEQEVQIQIPEVDLANSIPEGDESTTSLSFSEEDLSQQHPPVCSSQYTTHTGRSIVLQKFHVESSRSITGTGYSCPFCAKQFTHATRLRLHGLASHLDILFASARLPGVGTEIFREYCETAITSNISPDAVNKQEIRARCALCPIWFTDRRNIQKHWFFYHFEVLAGRLKNLQNPIQYSDYAWNIKGNTASSDSSPAPHPKKRKSKFTVVQESRPDPSPQPVEQVPLFKCTFSSCGQLFDTSGRLKEHAVQYHPEEFFPLNTLHTGQIPFDAYRRLCHRLFDDQNVKAIGNNMYSCPKCQQGYLSLPPVWVHMVESHHSDLSRHLLAMIKEFEDNVATEEVRQRIGVPETSQKMRKDRKYPALLECDACRKCFSLPTSLSRHRRLFCPVRRAAGLCRDPSLVGQFKKGQPSKQSNPLLRNLLGAPSMAQAPPEGTHNNLVHDLIPTTAGGETLHGQNSSLGCDSCGQVFEDADGYQQHSCNSELGGIKEEESQLQFHPGETHEESDIYEDEEESMQYLSHHKVEVDVKVEMHEGAVDDDPLGM